MRRFTIGIDVGGTKVLGLAFDREAPSAPLAVVRVPTPRGAARLTSVLQLVVADLRSRVEGELVGVGVGLAGFVDLDGVLRLAPNLPGADGLDLADRLGRQLDVPLVVDNDANCALWAEAGVGVASGCRDAVYVAIGTGIGGAVLVDGRVVRGAHGFAGEPGHMTIVPGGWGCACGRLGCWEAYASGSALGRLGREEATAGRAPAILGLAGGRVEAVTGEHVSAAFVAGDPTAAGIMAEFAGWIAICVANLVDVLDPEAVVLGGSISELGEALVAPVRTAFDHLSLGRRERSRLRIDVAGLGGRAAATGAALLASTASKSTDGERLRQ